MASKVSGCPKDSAGLADHPDSTHIPCSTQLKRRSSRSPQNERREKTENEDMEKRVDSPVDRLTKDGKRLGKDDRLEDSRIRERLKSGLRKDGQERKARGPMVAKPNVLSSPSSGSSATSSQVASSNSSTCSSFTSRRNSRTPSPSYTDSAFTRQVVSRPTSPGARKSPNSSVRVKHPSGSSSPRRTPSPSSVLDPVLNSDVAKKRVLKAMKARLYLLQQTGPNSLQIGGDSPNHKFKVIIGPQTCTCGKGPHCIHLLFVMLRVFQVSENDSCLWNKTLKNYEVEMLFTRYHDRRKKKPRSPSRHREKNGAGNLSASQESLSGSDTGTNEEEDLCPICLLEMIEGESLVQCEHGCQNKLHHHCISVWFEECRLQNDPLICPLCRSQWSLQHLHDRNGNPNEVNDRAPSPPTVGPNVFLPRAEDMTDEHRTRAGPWIRIFGEDLVSCLFSRSWVVRETSLPHLSQRVMAALSGERTDSLVAENVAPSTKEEVVEACCKIIAMVCSDPVYKVLIAGLKCLRNLLSYLACTSEEEVAWLKKCLAPVVETILMKCADPTRRTSQLALSTLEELAKGQQGELAVGRKTTMTDVFSLEDPVNFILKCILQDYSPNSVHWQWLLGRLYMIDRLMDRYPSQFIVRENVIGQDEEGHAPSNYERLLPVLRFALKEVNNAHIKIGKVARRVFVFGARLAVHVRDIFTQIQGMLTSLDRSLHIRMKRRLSVVANEFNVAQQVAQMVQREPAYDHNTFLAETENYDNEKRMAPEVPPNSPRARRRRNSSPGRRRQSSIPRVKKSSAPNSNEHKLPESHLTPPETPKSAWQDSGHFVYEDSHIVSKPPKSPKKNEHNREFRPLQNGYPLTAHSVHHTVSLPACRDTDLSDVTLSPSTPEDKLITFKTEVALSPRRGLKDARLPMDASGWYGQQTHYRCKEEIEEEEMIALACAMNASTSPQDTLPFIPGLSAKPQESAFIRIQPDDEEGTGRDVYLENQDWMKGPVLGTGAFSTCYQTRDVKTGTIMALKQIAFCRNSGSDQEKVVDAIKDEFGMMTKLNHPNIVRILGATQEGFHFNMFVEWMPGGSVAYLLDKYGPFSEMVLISYTQQVLRGLSYLHDNQILHRDLKGANLLVDSSGKQVRIADFGASAKLSAQRTQAGEFKGQLLGTIAFMAPEVLRGENYGRSCDIWSIGCVMIEMATCKPPWNACDLSNHLALIFKIASATKPPPIPDHLAPPIRDLMIRCLEHNSDDRPTARDCLKHPLFTQYNRPVKDTGD